ncbi:MAG: DUF512 domain-containing protein [Candidatus Saganbacteria bacterium]|nr:DUF512 domain-containing protein [Candidatus Saganbacteria bacterium]
MFGNIMDGDFFDHDQAMPILESLRQRFPQTELVINSSRGTNLNKPAIRNMADYKNILLRLQFVSANKKNRDMLVKRPSTDTEITSVLGWLRKYQLPFEIELVAIPHLLGWKDIERTFFFLDDYAPVRIKVYLFSFTKYYIKELTFSNNKKLLREFYSLVNKVSNKIGTRIDPFPRPVSKGDVQPDLLRVKQIRRTYKGRILFLVSQMAYPAIKKHISDTDGIKVKMAKNLFFGGNISVAGLLTAEDYLQAAGKEEFDVLVVSSKPFNYAGYDLKGDHKRLLKQRLGKKVLYI